MIVVADTSVILNLCRVQQEHLLQQLFPARVASEFERLAKALARFTGLILPDWIRVEADPKSLPSSIAQAHRRQLIPGVKVVLDRLEKEAGFWISPGLRAKVLQAAGE
jgi:predicted nucleic acid-binding protein